MPEALYDADFPGHYMRRIERIAVTVPCVAGPYSNVNATLTLLNARTRTSNALGSDYLEQPDDPRFDYQQGIMRQIAISGGNEDSGQLRERRDGRRGPFEGYGAIARFRLELPQDCNEFDIGTVTDAPVCAPDFNCTTLVSGTLTVTVTPPPPLRASCSRLSTVGVAG